MRPDDDDFLLKQHPPVWRLKQNQNALAPPTDSSFEHYKRISPHYTIHNLNPYVCMHWLVTNQTDINFSESNQKMGRKLSSYNSEHK